MQPSRSNLIIRKKSLFISLLFLISFTFISAGELKVTQEHPFLINGSWIDASQLKVGDELTLANGSKVTITKLTDVVSNESFKVYNLEAGQYHNFVVGEEGVVVHNSNSGNRRLFGPDGKPANIFMDIDEKAYPLGRYEESNPIAGQAHAEMRALLEPTGLWAKALEGIKSQKFLKGIISKIGSRGSGTSREGYFDMVLSDGTSVTAFRPLAASSSSLPLEQYEAIKFLQIMESNPSTKGLFPKYLGVARDNDGLFYIVLEKFPKGSRLVANSIKELPENTVSQIKSVVTPQLFNKFVLEGLNLQRGIEPDYMFVVDGNFRFGLSVRSSDFIKQVETQPIFKLDSQHKTCLKNIFEGCTYNPNLN